MSARRSTRDLNLGVLFVARPEDLAMNPLNGFAMRYRAILDAMKRDFSLSILFLRPSWDNHDLPEFQGVCSVTELPLPERSQARSARLGTAVMNGANFDSEWDRRLTHAAQRFAPNVVVTLSPWLDEELRGLFRCFPSMHFYEEDLLVMPELASQSPQGRLFRRMEVWLHSRARAQPQVVVSISPPEERAARRRYPRALHLCLPMTLPRTEWPLATTLSTGSDVLVVGNFGEPRNADGLSAVLERVERRSLQSRLQFRIVSGSEFNGSLKDFLERTWVTHVARAMSVPEEYRRARTALVPAVRATGQKITILQAWTSGCPVVCSEAAARTAPADTKSALLVGASPDALVDHLLELDGNPAHRQRLVSEGLRLANTRFDPDDQRDLLVAHIKLLAGKQALPPASTSFTDRQT
jgi:Glycosyl transferases group 1